VATLTEKPWLSSLEVVLQAGNPFKQSTILYCKQTENVKILNERIHDKMETKIYRMTDHRPKRNEDIRDARTAISTME
jgi:hypothetical protein